MSWRDRLQPASFRGVAFYTEQEEGTGGRHAVVHEFPHRRHTTQDMGPKSGKEQKLKAFVVGTDFDQHLSTLLDALNKPGPGMLTTRFKSQRVQINDVSWVISSQKGGYAEINISYFAAGRPKASPQVANASKLLTASANAQNMLVESQGAKIDVAGLPEHVNEQAQSQLHDALTSLAGINGRISAATAPLDETARMIDAMGNELGLLIRQPQILVGQLFAVNAAILGAYEDIASAFSVYQHLLDAYNPSHTISQTASNGVATPSRMRMAQNQQAIASALEMAVTLAFVGAIANKTTLFSNYQQAIDISNAVNNALDATAGDESLGIDEYHAIVDVQTALTEHVNDIAPGLARITQHQLGQTQPALVVAYDVYGDWQQHDALVTRNQISHPLFLPAGVPLEVLQ